MDWILLGQALLIVVGSVSAFVGFIYLTEKVPAIGTIVFIVGLVLAFTLLVYSVLGGDV